ncbi:MULTISPECIES: enoyl-CoA hydratase/isomerase family protein [Polaromonas]|uniref:Enoyl-CoA hydratase/isomerase family protein n=1 Tax=Polaromonas aquatica TaxID=332657 RepID=A0ABW1U1U7_9BURK
MGERQHGDSLRIERQENCVTLVLNRPDKLNPLDRHTVAHLLETVKALELDRTVHTVVLTGAGRAFSAGGDLDGYVSLYQDPPAFRFFLENFHALLAFMEGSSKIYIAAINGACVAGGLELLLACDVVIAAESAKIGDGHLNFGQLPGAGGSQRLPRAIGALRAKHLMLTGDMWTARQALDAGLVSEVVADDALLERCTALAALIATRSPANLQGAKDLVNESHRGSLEDGLLFELQYVHRYATTVPDATEGLIAFREKRKPIYGKP